MHKNNLMAITYKLPKPNADRGAYIVSPVAGDTALATGVLTLKDEDGNVASEIPINDIVGWSYTAYAAGTANIVDVDFTAAVLVADSQYAMTIRAPYVVNFFGGGAHATSDARESSAIYTTRTYVVSLDGTPTVTEIQEAFTTRINADINAYFTASNEAGDICRITCSSAEAGGLEVTTTAAGATIVDFAAWVSPSGTVSEFESELGVSAPGAGYQKYIVEYRKPVRHNAVKGLSPLKMEKFVYYVDKDDAGSAAAVTLVTSQLDGSYVTTADYLGAPGF